MARLPQVGQDNNTWGEVLNEYLSVSHNADGTLKDVTGKQFVYFIAASTATAKEIAIADAVCDGIADEVQINTALTAGYNVMLSTGTFIIAAPITATVNNVKIEGQGIDKTIIKRASVWDFVAINIGGDNWDIENFTLNGNSGVHDAGTTSSGVHVLTKNYLTVKNIKFTDTDYITIYLETSSTHITIEDCIFTDLWWNAIVAETGIENVKVLNCDFIDIDYVPIITVAVSGHPCTNWLIDGCDFDTCGYRVKIVGAENITINNCMLNNMGGGIPAGTNGSLSFEDSNNCLISNIQIINGKGSLEVLGSTNINFSNIVLNTSTKQLLGIGASETSLESSNINFTGGSMGNTSENKIAYIAGSSTNITFNGVHFYGVTGNGLMFNTTPTKFNIVNCTFINITGNAIGDYFGSSSCNNLKVQNNIFNTCGVGVSFQDGDDMMFTGNRFITCTTPIDISDANVVRVFIDSNDWYGSTNDPAVTGATSPVWGSNIKKDGGLYIPA